MICADSGGAEEGAQLLHPQVLAEPGRGVLPQARPLTLFSLLCYQVGHTDLFLVLLLIVIDEDIKL